MTQQNSPLEPQTGAVLDEESGKAQWKARLRNVNYAVVGPIVGLILAIIVFSILSPHFLTYGNIINILRQVSIIGVMAVGVTFVIISAEIDLSIAHIMTLCGLLAGALATGGYDIGFQLPVWLAFIVTILAGAGIGAIAGFFNAKLMVPSFMATLAMMYIAEGAYLFLSGAQPLYGIPDSLQWFGSGTLFGIPVIILVFAFVFIISHIVLSKTVFGRNLYAIGGNKEAAKMSGIHVAKHKIIVLMISGGCAALAGIMMLGRVGSAQVTAGVGLMLPPIAAVILGGTALFGGSGSMWRTLVGVFLMGVLVNGLNLLGIGSDGQNLAIGLVLLIAVAANVMSSIRR
ncbi:ABC transporter permease [Alkalihalobacillus oceani]|uniref:ABC transporter permease n=1 Tax=Halalkalibacter oceani TaxID=1653776 RepID=UPI00203FA91F|nr:ABC transporter permease [Halalkalibacter oceani]MCM3760189.1 ABC transporter permease [Halalkalibacter oceani]